MTTTATLSIVIPAFNESSRLMGTFAAITARFAGCAVEVIVADDGSTDATAELARAQSTDALPVRVVSHSPNRGKGAAVRAGVAATTGDRVLVMDADLATDLASTDVMVERLEHADIVIGSRALPGSVVDDSDRIRRTMGRTFNRMVRPMLGLDLSDTQCGFKMYRGDAARLIFSLSTVDGFAYDPEVLRIANFLDMTVEEIPVCWTAVADSKVRPVRDSVRTFAELLEIRRRVRPDAIRAAARTHGWVAP